jgi:UDP-N-acetyl-D-glucosamine dehydrogenase
MKIAVVGLGKIGLPLAAQYSSMGHEVIGCDVNPDVVSKVNQGLVTFSGEPGLEELVSHAVASGLLSATTNTAGAVSDSDAVVVVVPLLVDEEGLTLFEIMDSATRDVGKGLKQGTLVCFETTLPVGTTRNRLTPILEFESGLRAGLDFFVAFSPERVYTGRVFENLKQYPKLVGGINAKSSEAAQDFYNQVLTFDERNDLNRPNGVWDLGSSEAAELSKLAETTYRDVNIALANQFALYAEGTGIDIYKVIEACNSQPFSHIHQPGIAVGGHCIPVYPHMYLAGHKDASVVSVARETNRLMPSKVIERIESEIGNLDNLNVAILGLAYRGGVKEHAFSGTWQLVKNLELRGAKSYVLDPMYSDSDLDKLSLLPLKDFQQVDVVILHTNHVEFLQFSQSSFPRARLFVDGRNFARKAFESGTARYISLGVGC